MSTRTGKSAKPSRSSRRASEATARKLFWVRADIPEAWEARKAIVEAAALAHADLVIVRREDLDGVPAVKGRAVISKAGDLPPQAMRIDPDPQVSGNDEGGAALLTIRCGADQDLAAALAERYGTVIVDCKDWRIIPLENLVAACQRTRARLLAMVSGPEDAALALGVLERGVDGVVLQSHKPGDVERTGSLVKTGMMVLPLEQVEVVSVLPAGMGDRACIDTCSLLEKGEGMLVGSKADGLVLVHAETVETQYVKSRPFRVNAGAVHSYVLDRDNKTRYISDLSGGDSAFVVKANGSCRVVTIGRVKIETRPLAIVELKRGNRNLNVVLQDAETIRLVKADGEPVSIKELKKGDRVLAYLAGQARHFGMAIEEKLIER